MRRHFQPSLQCSEYQVSQHLFFQSKIPISDIFCVIFFTAWQLQKQLYQQLQKSRQKAGWQAKLLRLARRRRAPKKVLKYILGQNFANNEEAFKAQCLWFLPKNVQQLKTKTNFVPIYSIVFCVI